jgi:hypothetical protein
MRILWAAAVAGWLLLAAEAHADTVYLKDGQSVWGSEITEEGSVVIVSRPAGPIRIPKSDVTRIERTQLSIPRFYSAPAGGASTPTGKEDSAPDRRPSSAADVAPPPGPPQPIPPQGLTPTLLPPPPPPPPSTAR